MAAVATNTHTVAIPNFTSSPQTATINLGPASLDREIFIYFLNIDGSSSGVFISAASIDAVPLVAVPASHAESSGVIESVWYWGLIPAGTTGVLSVSFSGSVSTNSLNAIIYSVSGADQTTPIFDASSDNITPVDTISISIPTDGVLLGGASGLKASGPPLSSPPAWTGAVQDVGLPGNNIGGTATIMTASALSSTPGVATAVIADWSSLGAVLSVLSGVSIQPAAAPAPNVPVGIIGVALSEW